MNTKKLFTLTAVLNLVSALACLATLLAAILIINGYYVHSGEEQAAEDAGEAVGIVVMMIVLLPFAILFLFPSTAASFILHLVASISFFKATKIGKEMRKSGVIIRLVFRIIFAIAILFGAFTFGVVADVFAKYLTYIIFALAAAGAVLPLVATAFEFIALKNNNV